MTSPVEIVLSRSVAAAISKSTGWLAQLGIRKISDTRAARRLDFGFFSSSQISAIATDLDADSRQAVLDFCASPALGAIVYKIAAKAILRTHAGNADNYERSIRDEMIAVLSLHLNDASSVANVANELHDAIDVAIQQGLNQVMPVDQTGISATARASLVKQAAKLADQSVTNCELISRIQNLNDIDVFRTKIQGAIRALHSSMRLPHAGTSRMVPYERLFVPPRLSVAGDISDKETISHPSDLESPGIELFDALRTYPRVVLLGDPGGGKTTTSLKLLHDITAEKIQEASISVVFWVSLRDYGPAQQSGLSIIQFIEQQSRVTYAVEPPDHSVRFLLHNGQAAVFFDGLDELTETSDRRKIAASLEGFANQFASAPILVTSRKIGYSEASLDPELFVTFELDAFDTEQIESYAHKWFSLDDSIDPARRESITGSFLGDSKFVRDLTSNPLMLSLMCGLYAGEGYIPRNRPDVYEKCALLLFEKWDKQRGIKSSISFDAHIQSAIRHIAFHQYTSERSSGLSRNTIISSVKDYLLAKRFDDEEQAEQAAIQFVDFCKGRAWVLTEVGDDIYGFTHRTFLEYFTASYLVRTNVGPNALLKQLWPRLIASEWDVVCQLAVQLLNKGVDDGADNFLEKAVSQLQSRRISPARREAGLDFCMRTLEFLVPKPAVLDKLISACVDSDCERSTIFSNRVHERAILNVCNVTAENRPLAKKFYEKAVLRQLHDGEARARALSLALYLNDFGAASRAKPIASSQGSKSFWATYSTNFHESVQKAMDAHANTERWVAAELIRRKQMRVADAINSFGPFVLYDPSVAGLVLNPPIAYSIRTQNPTSTRATVGWRVTPEIIDEVVEKLTSYDGVWIKESPEFEFMDLHMREGGPKQKRSLAQVSLLLALPFLERMASVMPGETERERRIAAAEDYVGRLPMSTGRGKDRPQYNILEPSDPRIARLYAAWVEGRVNTFQAVKTL